MSSVISWNVWGKDHNIMVQFTQKTMALVENRFFGCICCKRTIRYKKWPKQHWTASRGVSHGIYIYISLCVCVRVCVCVCVYLFIHLFVYRRKFRSQTSDNMDRWKAEQGRGREKRKIRREKSRRERVRRKKMQMREKVGKSRNTVFFQWFGAPEGRKVGSLKRRVRSQLARWEMKNCTPLWREAHFELKMYKTHQLRTTFGSWDVEKVHAVVARSTFRSENVQKTPGPDHFWKLRCWKSARRCGAKHISKSKCTKHTSIGPLLEVAMAKNCKPLWREAHFEVKMYKTHHVRSTFGGSDVEKVHAVVARSTFQSQNVKNTRGWDHFWRFRCRFASLHYTPLHSTNSTTRNYTTLHYITLHSTTLHYTPLHYITLNDTAPQIDR